MKFKSKLRFLVLASLLNVTYETKPFLLTVSLFVSQVGPYLIAPLVAASSFLAVRFGKELWQVSKKVDKLSGQEQEHHAVAMARLDELAEQADEYHGLTISRVNEVSHQVRQTKADIADRLEEAEESRYDTEQRVRCLIVGGQAADRARDIESQGRADARHRAVMEEHTTLNAGQKKLQEGQNRLETGIGALQDAARQGVRLSEEDRGLLLRVLQQIPSRNLPGLSYSLFLGEGEFGRSQRGRFANRPSDSFVSAQRLSTVRQNLSGKSSPLLAIGFGCRP